MPGCKNDFLEVVSDILFCNFINTQKFYMKNIAMLVLHDAVSASIADPCIMFNGVNDFLKAAGKPPLFKVHFVGLTKAVKLHNGIFTVHADTLLKDMKKADLIIIPAIGGDLKTGIKKNKDGYRNKQEVLH